MLGPYPFSTLSLTENPSPESQGWPGLIFLSSYAYLQPEQLRAMNLSPADAIIYSEVMMPHELAHQWYGDQGLVGQLSRAVAAGGAGELLLAAAAGALAPGRRSAHAGELSPDPGQPNRRRAAALSKPVR